MRGFFAIQLLEAADHERSLPLLDLTHFTLLVDNDFVEANVSLTAEIMALKYDSKVNEDATRFLLSLCLSPVEYNYAHQHGGS